MQCPVVPMPPQIAKLPRDHRGYPIFKMVTYPDGGHNFTGQSGDTVIECVEKKLCAICGEELGPVVAFLGPIGIFDVERRNVSDPPMHRECVEYAARVCPFILMGGWDREGKKGWNPEHSPEGTVGAERPGKLVMLIVDEYAVYWSQEGQPFFFLYKPEIARKVFHAKIGRKENDPPGHGRSHNKAAKKATRRSKHGCAIGARQ
jgi:hypothetical protein